MKEYTVVPNKDATTWYVKAEDVAPIEEYDRQTEAVEEGTRLAEVHKPSKLIIFDENHEKQEIKTF
ncbi:DUF2188 domain-containing protein [Shouchella shacheensis]|uniref:DUF2188 domain-containing protein n=1 Tax=Shouchella shacheensis TaxID=1649580 RepID=UPI00073FB926|nr:DUF2188 domain-containing protein [Shouchella shacheensis]